MSERLKLDYECRISRIQNISERLDKKYICYVVIGQWDVEEYIELIRRFTLSLTTEQKIGWVANFTKAIFLVGNIDKVSRRVDFLVAGKNIAIKLSPAEEGDLFLAGILKPFDFGAVEAVEFAGGRESPATGACTLYVSSDVKNLPRAIINIQHLYAEVLIDNSWGEIFAARIAVLNAIEHVDSGDVYRRIEYDESDGSLQLRAVLKRN